MSRQSQALGISIVCGLLLTCLAESSAVGAGPGSPSCSSKGRCAPNAVGYGYFTTVWRPWPGPGTAGKVVAPMVGAEIIPSPAGKEEVPPPKATPLPNKPKLETPLQQPMGEQLPPLQNELPLISPTPGGSLLPNPGAATPEERPVLPDVKPTKPKAGATKRPAPSTQEPEELTPAAPTRSPSSEPRQDNLLPKNERRKSTNLAYGASAKGSGAADKPQSIAPLQADWNSALYPESLGSGNSRLTVCANVSPHRSAAVAIDGYCPVQLCENDKWVAGTSEFKAEYRGQVYLFSGPAERRRFLATPDRYVPANSGNDPVLALGGRNVPGKPEHAAVCNGRLYLFSSDAALTQFREEPERYTY